MKWLLIIIYVMFSNGGLLTVKYGFDNKINYIILIGLCMYVISFLLYMYLVSKYNLTYIIPICTGVSYVLIFVFSFFLLKESMSILESIGFFLIMLGIIFINI